MNYSETIQYLYQHLPMFTRVGAVAFKKDLRNIVELLRRLGNPQHQFKSIHIGGTNGKGSTAHMLAAIIQMAGYKTGLYTSPHLGDFRERIRINGQMIEEQSVIAFVQEHIKDFSDIAPSFFEMSVAMAFHEFAKQQVNIAIIEVGLGGRLDATNVIHPLLSVITNIGYDHMDLLGHSLKQIAIEKSGIIKPHTPVVIGTYQEPTAAVFMQQAAALSAPIRFASEEWRVVETSLCSASTGAMGHHTSPPIELRKVIVQSKQTSSAQHRQFFLDLTGTYQLHNLQTILSAVEALQLLTLSIDEPAMVTALKQVKKLTGLLGRWEIIGRNPLVIGDTAHNADALREVLNGIKTISYQTLHMVMGLCYDKDINGLLSLMPADALYYFCKATVPRGLDAPTLARQAAKFGLHGLPYPSVSAALHAAKAAAQDKDLIVASGSTFVVAEVLQ